MSDRVCVDGVPVILVFRCKLGVLGSGFASSRNTRLRVRTSGRLDVLRAVSALVVVRVECVESSVRILGMRPSVEWLCARESREVGSLRRDQLVGGALLRDAA
jgi:hypothetical protein